MCNKRTRIIKKKSTERREPQYNNFETIVKKFQLTVGEQPSIFLNFSQAMIPFILQPPSYLLSQRK